MIRAPTLAHAAILWLASTALATDAVDDRGRQLFRGDLALSGRVAGHDTPLPVVASRCVNCHAVAGAQAPAAAASTPSFGPLLGTRTLTRSMARRGGPPSRYDEAAFCRLLSSGIDPAYVTIARSMPRYEASAADCHALWVYLSTAGD